jgi:hypothetical protein
LTTRAGLLRAPTSRRAARRQAKARWLSIVAHMDEPTQVNESRFWDQVADWLLESGKWDASELTDADIEAVLRELRNDLDAP